MILADVLALASRKVSKPTVNGMNSLSPRLLVDFATLTGTAHNNITINYSIRSVGMILRNCSF